MAGELLRSEVPRSQDAVFTAFETWKAAMFEKDDSVVGLRASHFFPVLLLAIATVGCADSTGTSKQISARLDRIDVGAAPACSR